MMIKQLQQRAIKSMYVRMMYDYESNQLMKLQLLPMMYHNIIHSGKLGNGKVWQIWQIVRYSPK